jgi:hypothetical protein
MGILTAHGANPEEIGLLMAGVGRRDLDVVSHV